MLQAFTSTQKKALGRLWEIVPSLRLVGGCVRDIIMGEKIKDIDLATPLTPEKMMEVLRGHHVKVIPTGLSHGTVLAVIDGIHCEITTLRRDLVTDGRHAQVAFTDNWKEDAKRRDFTINALYLDREGKLYDYFGGYGDIQKRIVRFIGDPQKRIEEDALRILRYFRFYGRFSYQNAPDEAAIKAIYAKRHMLGRLSIERVRKELFLLFMTQGVLEALGLMAQWDILPEIFEEGYTLKPLSRLVREGGVRDPLLCLVLLSRSPQGLAKQFKLSRREASFVRTLLKPFSLNITQLDEGEQRVLLACLGRKGAVARLWRAFVSQDRTDVQREHLQEVIKSMNSMEVPIFPLSGKDVLKRGCEPGPEIGRILQDVRQWWLDNKCSPSLGECEERLRQVTS